MEPAVDLTRRTFRLDLGNRIRPFAPRTVFDLLRVWHWRLGVVEPGFTLADLLALLRRVEGMDLLSQMLECDVGALLSAAAAGNGEVAVTPVQAVEVYNIPVPTRYQENPARPDQPPRVLSADEAATEDALHELIGEPFQMAFATRTETATGEVVCQRVVPPAMHGRWSSPFQLHRDVCGLGAWDADADGVEMPDTRVTAALEFVPLSCLLGAPLRYNDEVSFHDGPPPVGKLLFKDRITITFGEFVHAIFSELGYLATSGKGAAVRQAIQHHLDRIPVRERDDREAWW